MRHAESDRRVPLPFVAIDVSGPVAGAPESVTTLLEACNEAFEHGRCELSGATSVPAPRRIVVRWADPEQLQALVSLDAPEPPLPAREASFLPSDSVVERWRSVGLIAGTMADEWVLRPPVDAHRNPPAERRPIAPRKPASRPAAVAQPTWVDALFATGPSLGAWRFGGTLRGSHGIAGPSFASIGVRYLERPRDNDGVALRWLTPSIGGGLRTEPWSDVSFAVRLDLIAEYAQASAVSPTSSASAAESRWAVGGRAGFDVGYRVASWAALVAGGDVTYTGRAIELRVEGREVGSVGASSAAMLLGARATFR